MHDPATVAYVISPELFTVNRYYCDVECKGELTTGFTLIDKANYYHDEKPRNLTLIESIDRKAFVSLFLDAVKRYPR
jgi:inosine-uridine nucleoside N-ribohydrolase